MLTTLFLFRGRELDELEDYNYNTVKPRRRSNSLSISSITKSKYEVAEEKPEFQQKIHGPSLQDKMLEEFEYLDHQKESQKAMDEDGDMERLTKSTTSESLESVGEDKE